jgi:hypothetical protein
MRICAGVVLMSVILAGCDNPTTPLAPSISPAPQAASPPGPREVQLTGIVMDTAFRPLAGAVVEILDGALAGSSATTGADGLVSFVGALEGAVRVKASKDSHLDATETPGPTCNTCGSSPRRWVFFYLGPTVPPAADLSGSYTLTVAADPACQALPDDLRTRTYDAAVAPVANSRHPAGTHFAMKLTGASFPPFFDGITIGVAGELIVFEFMGEGLGFVEQVAPRTTLGFGGRAEVTVGSAAVSRISTTFKGVVDYCVLASDTGRFYDCTPADTHVACESASHRLSLAKR